MGKLKLNFVHKKKFLFYLFIYFLNQKFNTILKLTEYYIDNSQFVL